VGAFGGGTKIRDCAVPAGKQLFFPIVNCDWIHVPKTVPVFGDNKTTVEEVWKALQSPKDGCGPRDNASGLHATVDGVEIKDLDNPATTPYYVCAGPANQGCKAPAFSVTFHFSVFGPATVSRLVTQMYFPDDPLHPLDPIFNSIPSERGRAGLIAAYDHALTEEEWALGYRWDIVVRGPNMSVFEQVR